MRRFLFLLALLLWKDVPAQSGPQPALCLPIRAFTADDGLGGATITSLLKDARGFLWIGTPDELLLYDGTRFQPFRYADSAGAPQSFRRACLFSLGLYGVFIAHEEGTHQFVLPAGKLRAVQTPFHDFYVQSSMRAEDASSSVFYGSTGEHSARFDAQIGLWSDAQKHTVSHLTALRVTPAGKTLLGCDTTTSARILRLYDRSGTTPPEVYYLPFRASCIVRLAEGALLLEAGDGRTLWWMDSDSPAPRPVARLRVAANNICAAYTAGNACHVTAGHTLLRFHPASGRAQEILREDGAPVVRSGVFTHLLPDGRTLWAGSNTSGLIRVSLGGPRLRHLRADSSVLNWSHGIFPDLARGRIYVGSYAGTVSVFNTSGNFLEDLTPTLRRAASAFSAYINAIEPLPDGRLLILSGHNPWVYNPATRAVANLLPDVEKEKRARDIDPMDYQGRFGVLRTGPWEWWMTEKIGLVRWRIIPARGGQRMQMEIVQTIPFPKPTPEALCSYDGKWWCARAGKLYSFDVRGIRDSFSYPIAAFATSVADDGKGRLWIATESGIAIWRAGKVERILTTDDGLPNNHVYALLPDGAGRMWGSTNGGLFAVRLDDFSVQAFTGGDGLQGAEFNLGSAAQDGRGRLYFGGMNGVNIVEPGVALREAPAPPVTITRVAGADTVYYAYPGADAPPALRLPHDRASLALSFTASQTDATGPLRFEYRLRREDSVWTDNGTRRELQLFLAPGRYRVGVRVRGQAAAAVGFSVEVAPPFYRTWWAIALLILSAGTVAIVAIQRAARRRYERRLAALETARRIQEEKERISRELHDELGARAALLSHNAALLKETGDKEAIGPLTARITETTADMLTALRETVWTLKQEEVTVESLWLRYKNFIAKLAATYGHIRFAVEEDALPAAPLDYARALHLLRILQEAAMNAVKHSGAAAIVTSVQVAQTGVCFSVADDGRGFDVARAEERAEGNGLLNMAHRSREAGLRFGLRQRSEGGTVVEVCIT